MFLGRYKNRLEARKAEGLYRSPPEIMKKEGKYVHIRGRKVLNFSSNDYLGLGSSDKLKKIVASNFKKFSASASSSRLVSGNYSVLSQAEKAYARYFGYDQALFFSSGYQANTGIISALFEKEDTIFFDKHVHASSIEGIRSSGAEFHSFRHNKMSHLGKRLRSCGGGSVGVITESLFSMDGDFLDIDGFKKLKKEYGFFSVVDEAHAFGAIGIRSLKKGRGVALDAADIAVGTFGKAFGLFGAFVLLPERIKEYLLNFSSPLIYSTALPEAHAASAIELLEIIESSREKRQHLHDISQFMRDILKQEGFSVTGDAHIIAVQMGPEERALAVARGLLKENIFVFPARYPAVPIGKAILRIGMTALHNEADVKYFVDKLKDLYGAAVEKL